MLPDPCVYSCMRAHVFVCHNEENMPGGWQAGHATQAILVSIAQPKKKKE